MNNTSIVNKLKLFADLLELHNGDSFKIKALRNAHSSLRKVAEPIMLMSAETLTQLPGIGKNTSKLILQLAQDGFDPELDRLLSETPEGVVEMFHIKGLGPKRIARLWQDMEVDSVGELIKHCDENRLMKAKGFGEKSQRDILEMAQLYLNSKGKWLYAKLRPVLADFEESLSKSDIVDFQLTGQAYRKQQVVEDIIYIVEADTWPPIIPDFLLEMEEEEQISGRYKDILNVTLILCQEDVKSEALELSFGEDVDINQVLKGRIPQRLTEEEVFHQMGIRYIPAELRWNQELSIRNPPNLVDLHDIRGIVHTHTLYSDGIHSVKEMSEFAKDNGFDYIAISDHSRSAFYANGLSVERIEQQHREIDAMAKEFNGFKIFKSIESDILGDGSLDYDKEVLESFDFVIGSIHSDLKMPKEKATTRIIRAIENPHLNMLGHMTGRLLLSRRGYELDIEKVLDACAANKVVIEINANPQRLDIDYTLLQKVVKKNIKISINPDAHSKHGILDVQYGVIAARCGGLEKESVINTLAADQFLESLRK